MEGPMTEADSAAQARQALVQVRTAYRLLQAYHRRLFDIMNLLRNGMAERFGDLEAIWWGPPVRTRVPAAKVDPLTRWVLDYEPLARFDLLWASAPTPEPGSFLVYVGHTGDTALDGQQTGGRK